MIGFITFLKKELIEAVKTYKLLILGAVFLIFGMMSPLMAKMMPEIMKWAMASDPQTAGIDLSSLFTEPKALDAWIQFYSNIGQIGLIVLVIVFSGMLSSEISKGTLTIILTKGLARKAAILAKLTSAVLIWTANLTIAFLISWGYTVYFFPGEKLEHIGFAVFCLWVFGVFLLSLTTLAAALTKTTIFCMLSVGGGAVALTLLNIIPFINRHNPITLNSVPIQLLSGTIMPKGVYPTLIATSIIIAFLILASVVAFDQRGATKKSAVIAFLLAFLLVGSIIFSEGFLMKNNVNKHIITEDIIVGAGGEWELLGKLTLPKEASGKVPAVVLVHGSGPNDMDERIFDNKPFEEIAEYLAENGIAAIRYNKRTYTYGLKIAEQISERFTVFEETIEDALFAAEILRADPRIDETRVFILGHSLGGMLAPRIHAMGGDFAGLILFAGSPRFLLEIMKDQQNLSLDLIENKEQREAVIAINKQFIDKIEAGILLSDEEAQKIIIDEMGGLSAYYFKDMYDNPPAKFIADISVPFLVMHAGNDLQVYVESDFNSYKELLAGRDNATFMLYEGLNHLFMPSKVTDIGGLLEEYQIKANVDGRVLYDIAAWVKEN
ncbi:MAG: alpha/beta fold hydrolase [Lachnospiraceae bacterium]|nr:alpha/beta fold hydrolase [Lachnospiraceae bacterium]